MNGQDDHLIKRAIRLAMSARGHVEPNPMVGCILAHDGQIIGEGIHARVGGPHAEPTALADCHSRGNDPAGATAYVTLEPCCHVNKRTPPCAPRLIEAKIARVVIGCVDPNPAVDGKGIAMLRDAGIIVDFASDEVQAEAKQLLAPFTLATRGVRGGGPYVTLKWAESADGYIAKPGGGRTAISNARSNRAVHELRSRCDAIVIGVGTAIADDPMLTPRDVLAIRSPLRVVLDRQLRLPLTSRLVQTAREHRTLILTAAAPSLSLYSGRGLGRGAQPPSRDSASLQGVAPAPFPNPLPAYREREFRERQLLAAGVEIETIDDADSSASAIRRSSALAALSHVLVEPGPTLAASMLPWADRLWIIRSPNKLGDGVRAAHVPDHYVATASIDLDGDTLTEYLNTRGDGFFAPVPSADFAAIANPWQGLPAPAQKPTQQ